MIDEARLVEATDAAEEAFWAVVVEHFPECKTGDFDMDSTNEMFKFIDRWVNLNKPTE